MRGPRLAGRQRIYTDKTREELSNEAVLRDELDRVFEIHQHNVEAIRFLSRYYLGEHPAILERKKKIRPDVDNKIVVDYAFSFTRDITGYFLGKSVRYVQRTTAQELEEKSDAGTDDPFEPRDDAGDKPEDGVDGKKPADDAPQQGGDGSLPCPLDDCEADRKRHGVEELNHIFDIENKGQVDWDVAVDMSICGVGYKGVFVDNDARNGTHLSLSHLDPETTFVVYSAGDVKVPMFAVSYWGNNVKHESDKKTFVTVYTQDDQFLFEVDGDLRNYTQLTNASAFRLLSKVPIDFNGSLPIIEYRNNRYGLGDWEVAIPLMDGIDTLASDGVNDVEQFVANVLVAIGIEFDEETQETLNNVGVLNVPQLPPGMEYPPDMRYITPQLDAVGASSIREYLESCLRVIVGVPDRKTRGGGGGDTGDAVYMRDGWQDIDLVAANKECWFIQSEREALNVALYVLGTFGEISDIEVTDVEIKFNRNKTSNVQSKAQVLQTLWNILDPVDALDISDLTTNVQDVIIRAEKYQEKRLQQQVAKQNALFSSTDAPDGKDDKKSDFGGDSKFGDSKKDKKDN